MTISRLEYNMAKAKTLEQTKSRQDKALAAIRKTIEEQAQILLDKDGRFHDRPSNFYGIIIGAKSIHGKTPEELKERIILHLIRKLAGRMITPTSSISRWKSEIEESRKTIAHLTNNQTPWPLQRRMKETDETGLFDAASTD